MNESHREAIRKGMAKKLATGWKPKHKLDSRKGFEAMTPESRSRAIKTRSDIMRGRPQNMNTVCGKHANNINAKWWKLKNNDLGVVLEGKNLNQLIRDNEHLFESHQVVWVKSGCIASRGLGQLNQTVNRRLSWRGWVLA